MPNLSLIVPHRGDDARFEETLVAILENRPEESEVIVVHDGTYQDPYQLGDEVVFVQTDRRLPLPQLLNEGLMASFAPIIGFVVDGTIVSQHWADEAVYALQDDLDLVSVAIPTESRGQTSFGIDGRSLNNSLRLKKGAIHQHREREVCASSGLTCGLFRRSVLLALDGLKGSTLTAAEYDLAVSFSQLGLESECETEVRVVYQGPVAAKSDEVRELAEQAAAHGLVAAGWLAALQQAASTMIQSPATAMAWLSGVRSATEDTQVSRIEKARERIEQRNENSVLDASEYFSTSLQNRRAA
ncbi:MAG: hypothetical protein ACE361_23405 [Aureliella sp.]